MREIRIIGGSLRRSKIAVIDAPGLRPTPDRVRETLYNWLAATIEGSRVLDCFAGTGALGIEALSRGAAHVDFVESFAPAAKKIEADCLRLKVADRAAFYAAPLQSVLPKLTGSYQLILIDPPFDLDAWQSTLTQLQALKLISDRTQIYLEFPDQAATTIAQMPLRAIKQSRAGTVHFGLYGLI